MKTTKFLTIIFATLTVASCDQKGNSNASKAMETQLDSVSYAVGLDMASNIKAGFTEVDKDLLIEGLKNGMDSLNFKIEKKEAAEVVRSYFQKKQQAEYEKSQVKAETEFADVKKENIDFLEKNKKNKKVKTTASGLQYLVLKKGKGKKATAASRVKVHYHGTLIDGTVFDSSIDRKTPFDTSLNQVIKGWTEGVSLMNVGARYRFFVPENLAYGATPRSGGVIKPFMTLIFDIELLEIIK